MGRDKLLAPCGGRPLLARTLESLAAAGLRRLVIGVREDAAPAIRTEVLAPFGPPGVELVAGGSTRCATVARCLAGLGPDVTHVLVHDAARPFCSPDLVLRVMAAAEAEGAACAALQAVETVHRAEPSGLIAETFDRATLWQAQTPQAFRRDLLELSHRGGLEGTDDAGLAVRAGVRVRLVDGERTNVKVTFPEDLALGGPPAAAPAGREAPLPGPGSNPAGGQASAAPVADLPVRVGLGHDVHRFAAGRPLVLGGVRIPHHQGLEGHSDADVLAHAIADAVLGAAGLGDLGRHFPPSDERWRGADSLALLRRCADLAAERGWAPLQVDSLVVAEAPRLAPHAPAMERNLAGVLGLPADRVNVKAGTNEGMGALGRAEGMAATAVVLLRRVG